MLLPQEGVLVMDEESIKGKAEPKKPYHYNLQLK